MCHPLTRSVSIVTLGCSKNIVDSEHLAKQLEVNGYKVYNDPGEVKSTIVIVNTCGFIHDAKEESVDTILQLIQLKKRGLIEKLIVMGCLSERYRAALKAEMPEVDYFFGVFQLQEIIKVMKGTYNPLYKNSRLISTPGHYAYLRISEGCDRTCSFCAIPLIKGKHISRPIDELVGEAMGLTAQGVIEILLIAQDLTYYGYDISGKQQLPALINKLIRIDQIEWLRLHYIYPLGFPYELLMLMKESAKLCKYLDVPFQHISDSILRNMRRVINKRQTYTLIERFRKEVPAATLRTTLMVGFPGEGDKEFRELLDFVKEVKFDRLGVFTYSEEEGTGAAKNFKDTIPVKVKKERMEEIMAVQQEISLQKNKTKIGQRFKAIIDRREGDYFIGRTEYDSPEVDNELIITANRTLRTGDFCTIGITDATEHDLFGCLV